jgi:hypothetical protein
VDTGESDDREILRGGGGDPFFFLDEDQDDASASFERRRDGDASGTRHARLRLAYEETLVALEDRV